MKQQFSIVIIALIILLAEAHQAHMLRPTHSGKKHFIKAEHDQHKDYGKGCWKGHCWTYCHRSNNWCYTRRTLATTDIDKIPCSGSTHHDDSCPSFEEKNYHTNCQSNCHWY